MNTPYRLPMDAAACRLSIRACEYHGKQGFRVYGRCPDYIFPVAIFVRTRAVAEYIRGLFATMADRDERSRLVDNAICAEVR